MARGKAIALLGGSFNPPHVAHLMAAYWTLATQAVSEVWLLPSYRHPFGKELAPFEDRVAMCELAVRALRGAAVCGAEAELRDDPLVGKTVRTLEHLREKHPSYDFALVVGADVLPETDKWYRWDRVKELARVIVVGRDGFPPVPGAPSLPAISSTEIRALIARGEDVSGVVPRKVREYAEAKGLYR
ncbi:MAG TPA: nicotinate (nicotinamide) nucleotide adenylyltransferase [Anaeromyxobacter sp.]|nr:nicotinate (nicotinamide) nucleotide adenylyltransferase [Anaeromyxobacter sp.]